MTKAITDPFLVTLPSPYRQDIVEMDKIWKNILQDDYDAFSRRADNTKNAFAALDYMLGLNKISILHEKTGPFAITAYLMNKRFKKGDERVLYVPAALTQEFAAQDTTYLADALHPAMGLAYLKLGNLESIKQSIRNNSEKPYILEGCFIEEHMLDEAMPDINYPKAITGIEPGQPLRVIDLLLCGSPYGHDHMYDDNYVGISFYIQDNGEDLDALIKRHIAYEVEHNPFFRECDENLEAVTFTTKLLASLFTRIKNNGLTLDKTPAFDQLPKKFTGVGFSQQARIKKKLRMAKDKYVLSELSSES